MISFRSEPNARFPRKTRLAFKVLFSAVPRFDNTSCKSFSILSDPVTPYNSLTRQKNVHYFGATSLQPVRNVVRYE